ncbi:MAG: hypothetical protein ACFFDT_12785 [Candidatus Hodarchaeota archaeon]
MISKNLVENVELIKDILLSGSRGPDPEGELSDWAKKELEDARKTPYEEYISMEDIEKEFLQNGL